MQTPELDKALLAVQQTVHKVKTDAENDHFKNKYITLTKLVDTLLPVLHANGLYLTQSPNAFNSDAFVLNTTITHVETGQTLTSAFRLPPDTTLPQKTVGYITYARRCAISCMLGIVIDTDDDGESAMDWRAWSQKHADAVRACQSLGDLGRLRDSNESYVRDLAKESSKAAEAIQALYTKRRKILEQGATI